MMGIALCYNIFLHLFVQHQHLLNMILSVCPFYFNGYFFVFYLINDTIFTIILRQTLLELLSQTYIIVLGASVHLNMGIKYF